MKSSLRIFVNLLWILALLGGGAIVGAMMPQRIMTYIWITIAAIAALALIFIGFNGHKNQEEEETEEEE